MSLPLPTRYNGHVDRRTLRELQDKRLRDLGFTVVKRTGTKMIVGEHAARLAKAVGAATVDEQAPDCDGRPSVS